MTIAIELHPPEQETAIPEKEMTAEEFETWALVRGAERVEWVHGKIITMAPANLEHVDLNGWLQALLRFFVEQRGLGAAFGPELLVRLSDSRRVPDVLFVKKENLARLKPTALDGPADLVIEIISPDSAARDWREKYLEYEAAGVGEYWVIAPTSQVVECYVLGEDRKFHLNPAKDEKIASFVLPGFFIRPSWLWQRPLPLMSGVLVEMGITF